MFIEAPVGVNELIKIPGGKVNFGKPVTFPSYGWDNEYGHEYIELAYIIFKKIAKTYSYFLIYLLLTSSFTHSLPHPLSHSLTYSLTHYHSVPAFEASKYKVTNREFLEFVESGGYTKKELWTEEGE